MAIPISSKNPLVTIIIGGTGNTGNTGADGADGGAANIEAEIHAAAAKTVLVNDDELGILDSADGFGLKKSLWSSIKSSLKIDDTIHDNVAGEIVAIAEKTVLSPDDHMLIEDSGDSNSKKRAKLKYITRGGTF